MERKVKKQMGPSATALWRTKTGGHFRLLFYEFPDAQSVLPPFPVDIKPIRQYRQALLIKTEHPIEENKPAFQGQIWLPPAKAFMLYDYMQGLMYGSQDKFKLMDDSKTVYFNRGEKHLLSITCVSQKGAGRIYLDYQSTFIFASMLKNNAQMSLPLPHEEEGLYVELRRFGDWIYFNEPFTANITTQEVERLRKFLEEYLREGQEEKDIKPVLIKDIYTFRYIPLEGIAYLVYPYGKIAIDKERARKILLIL